MINLSKILKEIEIKPEFVTNPKQLKLGNYYLLKNFTSKEEWSKMKYHEQKEDFNLFEAESGVEWEMRDNFLLSKIKRREIKYA